MRRSCSRDPIGRYRFANSPPCHISLPLPGEIPNSCLKKQIRFLYAYCTSMCLLLLGALLLSHTVLLPVGYGRFSAGGGACSLLACWMGAIRSRSRSLHTEKGTDKILFHFNQVIGTNTKTPRNTSFLIIVSFLQQ